MKTEEAGSRAAVETSTGPLFDVERLCKVFDTRAGKVRAVDDVSFAVERGETVGVVGESGSGKSTVIRLMLRLQEPTSGRVVFDGTDLSAVSTKGMAQVRRRMQMIFQNPYGSLLPHYSAVSNVAEPLRVHRIGSKTSRREEALRLLELVGIGARAAGLYPRQLSGGQQQRVAIARALALEPDFLACDEPTSSLDVSIQSQILNLVQDLQRELSLTCVFVSHNLAVIERVASRVLVMCRGRLVEVAPTERLFGAPTHPYTKILLAAVLPIEGIEPVELAAPDWDSAVLDEEDATLVEVAPGHFVRTAR